MKSQSPQTGPFMSTNSRLNSKIKRNRSQSPQTGPFMSTYVREQDVFGRQKVAIPSNGSVHVHLLHGIPDPGYEAGRNPLKRVRSCPLGGSVKNGPLSK